MMKHLKGIDVSYHNGNIDWNKVKEDGIEFAMLRMGYGEDVKSQDDETFLDNVKGCEKHGIKWGAYFYSYATSLDKAKSELKHIERLMKGKKPHFPVALDMEDADGYKRKHGNPNGETLVKISEYLLDGIEKLGFYAILYANRSWLNGRLKDKRLDRFDKWVAEWNDECTYKGKFHMWQYTDKGKVNGIKGNVDMNYSYLDFSKLGQKKEEFKTYQVKTGDTLSEIANVFDVKISDIMKANPQIKNINEIYSGNFIKIPKK